MELIDPKTLSDTLRCVGKGGIVCDTDILGGVYTLNGFDPIKEIPNSVYLIRFFPNFPTQRTIENIFPLSTVTTYNPPSELSIPLRILQIRFPI